MNTIELYYDFRSPFAYFASQRLSLLTDAGAEILWKPASVSVLLNLQVGRDPRAEVLDPLCVAKRAHFMADLFRLIDYWNITFARPLPIPPVCDKAMEIVSFLDDKGIEHSTFRKEIFEAVWQKQKDVNDISVLTSLLEISNLDVEIINLSSTNGADLLVKNSVTAYEAGIFGVPSFVFNNEIYFGADRMELLASRVSGE